jgi:hypothetical protein
MRGFYPQIYRFPSRPPERRDIVRNPESPAFIRRRLPDSRFVPQAYAVNLDERALYRRFAHERGSAHSVLFVKHLISQSFSRKFGDASCAKIHPRSAPKIVFCVTCSQILCQYDAAPVVTAVIMTVTESLRIPFAVRCRCWRMLAAAITKKEQTRADWQGLLLQAFGPQRGSNAR